MTPLAERKQQYQVALSLFNSETGPFPSLRNSRVKPVTANTLSYRHLQFHARYLDLTLDLE
jgi:hypothetical protein